MEEVEEKRGENILGVLLTLPPPAPPPPAPPPGPPPARELV